MRVKKAICQSTSIISPYSSASFSSLLRQNVLPGRQRSNIAASSDFANSDVSLFCHEWYRPGNDSPNFILYSDGTCSIGGTYGTGTWSIVNNNLLKSQTFIVLVGQRKFSPYLIQSLSLVFPTEQRKFTGARPSLPLRHRPRPMPLRKRKQTSKPQG